MSNDLVFPAFVVGVLVGMACVHFAAFVREVRADRRTMEAQHQRMFEQVAKSDYERRLDVYLQDLDKDVKEGRMP